MAYVRVVIYCRASVDRTGEELSVMRQVEDARLLAKARGWTVVAELTDNDVSAAGGRRRPAFEQALQAVQDGHANAILAWDMTRLSRNARDRLRLLEAGKTHGVTLAFVRGSDLDLGTPAGRLTADILGSVAEHEIAQKSDRQRRASRQAAEQGRRVGGRRPFGYESNGIDIREVEAVAVRAAYEAVLSGVPLGRIAAEWNAAGLRTPQRSYEHGCGGTCAPTVRPRQCPKHVLGEHSEWMSQTVRPLLLNPRYAGLRAHVPESRRESGGDPRKLRLASVVGAAAWPALVGEETFRAAVDLITDPGRTRPARSSRALLTGLALCGISECGATVHAGGGPARGSREPYAAYRCSATFGHVGRAAGPCDWWISEIVIERLSRPDAADLLEEKGRPDAEALRSEARALRVRRKAAPGLFADGVIDESELRETRARIDARLGEIQGQMADAGRVNILGPFIWAAEDLAGDARKEAVRAVWESLDIDRRRAAISVLMTVRLLPPGRGTRLGRDIEAWKQNAARIRSSIEVAWLN